MALEFVQDAITLSGLTGSKLKCDVVGEYYSFWWNITSGGPSSQHSFPTAIVELDAATGEVFIKDTGETVLGSAGHALDLKLSNPSTQGLTLVLVEKDASCYQHLKNVIRRRWVNVNTDIAEGPLASNKSNIYLMNKTLDSALSDIERLPLGNALFFFDPLRGIEYATIEKVATRRVNSFYKTMTEFIVFVFTSDWFLGRDDFAPLPTTPEEGAWSAEEKKTVAECDGLLGYKGWRGEILRASPVKEREEAFIRLYRDRLHRWFRFVLPLPFNPKTNQVFHLILCSNFSTGVRRTRDFYSQKTGNPQYSPDNAGAFRRFRENHPEVFPGLDKRRKPPHWRILWKTIVDHEEGVCDALCSDFKDVEGDSQRRVQLLEWLEQKGYLRRCDFGNPWDPSVKQYRLNWEALKGALGIDPPVPLVPLSSPKLVK
jgi:three-Cys-motif partner protein